MSHVSISILASSSPLCEIFGGFGHTTMERTHLIYSPLQEEVDGYRSCPEGALHIIKAGNTKVFECMGGESYNSSPLNMQVQLESMFSRFTKFKVQLKVQKFWLLRR